MCYNVQHHITQDNREQDERASQACDLILFSQVFADCETAAKIIGRAVPR